MKLLASAAVLALAVVFAWPAPPAAARPVQAEDLYRFTLIDEAAISPDGARVAYVTSLPDGPSNSVRSTVRVVDVATGKSIDATKGEHDSGVAWKPDSSGFAFVRNDDKLKKPEIWFYDVASGKITELTHLADGASGPVYSHDGTRIAFTVTTTDPPHAAWIDFGKAGFTPKESEKKSDVRIIDQMHFAFNGEGYVYDKHDHIWSMRADGSAAAGLTSGQWSEDDPAWSPDDKTIAFQSLRYDSPSLGPSDVYTIASTGGAITKLVSALPSNSLAGYGNTSDRIWYFASGIIDPDELPGLYSADPGDTTARVLIPHDRVSFGDSLLADMKEGGGTCGPLFTPDDASFVMNVDGPGYANLRRIDARTGAIADLTPPKGEAWGCTISKDGSTIAYLYSDATHPADVYIVGANGGPPRKLTGVNDALLSQLALSVPQPFTVRDDAGYSVQAWFMPATGGAPGAKHPTLLDIHGGPETQFGDTFFHEFQFWTSLGYNVVYCDPRGSTGHGYAFEEALARDWGKPMFNDVQAVMNAAVERPDVDASHLGVLGGSYGGYAMLWVISHTNRYKVAIAERSVSNLATEQLAADLASDNALGGRFSWGLPWQPNNTYASQSPITYVARVHTPLLILHSDDDIRTPIDQTLQEFNALKILGRTVEYVDVPGETHDLSRTGTPLHRVERLNILAAWLQRYLSP